MNLIQLLLIVISIGISAAVSKGLGLWLDVNPWNIGVPLTFFMLFILFCRGGLK